MPRVLVIAAKAVGWLICAAVAAAWLAVVVLTWLDDLSIWP